MPRFPDEMVQETQAVLEELRTISSSLRLAVVLSDDGFEVSRVGDDEAEDGRFASMASSIQALSEAVTDDRKLGKQDVVVIQAGSGKILQLRLAETYVLSAQFSNEDLLGRNLIDLRKVAPKLRNVLNSYKV
jgi:predicted regulator of Ras-like GTPase activity (Roadblock/LC7/MglB family)